MKNRICPHCSAITGQLKNGKNRSGTQKMYCKECKKTYTLEPKRNSYNEETINQALKLYYSGVSGRGVGKILGMSKGNVYNWIKKRDKERKEKKKVLQENYEVLELVAVNKSSERIQKIVASGSIAKKYYSLLWRTYKKYK